MAKSLADIKRAQKESLLLRELSNFYLRITMDDDRLKDITLNRVKLSKDKSMCTLFFFSTQGVEHFEKTLPFLILYKPSMRKALSQSINARYTPQLVFKYDASFEKHLQIDALLDQLKTDEQEDGD
jgi:ribosome-binding factor A